ncbi:hypothetical protein ABH15_01290 [Methanoculleus taiwanensis]|uniref:Kinase binding protein CGI-121 n=1 Tax=Methanoculleus taiwanensis TaxID=1550565 RepID=A0A498H487_9EURY|nr:KEOPS complex subunit Cgi121 [Methanoculleus taiwanensis]RXE56820.1 hypothetical protein ABH15_01290 [Methanoculleus taiwanensis]
MDRITCEIHRATARIDDKIAFLHRVRAIADTYETHIILFDADLMAGEKHVRTALEHAYRSYAAGTPIANSLEMEVLLYAAGTRQCLVATNFGIHQGENRLYTCICPPAAGARKELAAVMTFVEEEFGGIDEAKAERLMEAFGITRDELEAVGEDRIAELVLERVALLDVYR